MEQLKGTYYRQTGTHDFCGCEILPPPTYEIERIMIDHVEFFEEIKINGQKKQNAFVVTFAKNPYTTLPFCLNSGNSKRLAKQTWDVKLADGSTVQGRIDLVRNFPVRLCRELTRDPSDGGQIYGLRISKIPAAAESAKPAPAASQKKVLPEDKVDVVINWAKEKGKTIADVEELYEMNQKVHDAIVKALSVEDLPE